MQNTRQKLKYITQNKFEFNYMQILQSLTSVTVGSASMIWYWHGVAVADLSWLQKALWWTLRVSSTCFYFISFNFDKLWKKVLGWHEKNYPFIFSNSELSCFKVKKYCRLASSMVLLLNRYKFTGLFFGVLCCDIYSNSSKAVSSSQLNFEGFSDFERFFSVCRRIR